MKSNEVGAHQDVPEISVEVADDVKDGSDVTEVAPELFVRRGQHLQLKNKKSCSFSLLSLSPNLGPILTITKEAVINKYIAIFLSLHSVKQRFLITFWASLLAAKTT